MRFYCVPFLFKGSPFYYEFGVNDRNLIVRVCGFSARFTSLSKRW